MNDKLTPENSLFNPSNILSLLALLLSIAVMILTCNQNEDQYRIAQDSVDLSKNQFESAMAFSKEQFDSANADRISEQVRNHYRDSIELYEFLKSFELNNRQFKYQISRDINNFSYQQEINKRWLALLDSQSINTAEALKFQKQLIEQNIFVNAPYVQIDSVIWNSRGEVMSVFLKNFGNRPALIKDIFFRVVSPQTTEVSSGRLNSSVIIDPNRSVEVTRVVIKNPKVIFTGDAYYSIKFTVNDFRGDLKDTNVENAYHFDFIGGKDILYAHLRTVPLEEALKAMERTFQMMPR